MLDAQLFLQAQPRVTEKIACLTDERQYWRQILNIHRLSLKVSTILFKFYCFTLHFNSLSIMIQQMHFYIIKH
jgi:hypothetical protein